MVSDYLFLAKGDDGVNHALSMKTVTMMMMMMTMRIMMMMMMMRTHSEVLLVTGNVGNSKADCSQHLVTMIRMTMMTMMTTMTTMTTMKIMITIMKLVIMLG